MRLYRCLECRRAVPHLMLRVHLVTFHPVTAHELKIKRIDEEAAYEAVRS